MTITKLKEVKNNKFKKQELEIKNNSNLNRKEKAEKLNELKSKRVFNKSNFNKGSPPNKTMSVSMSWYLDKKELRSKLSGLNLISQWSQCKLHLCVYITYVKAILLFFVFYHFFK